MSKSIKIIESSAVPLNMENIDTDQIIPARFLKATTRDGFGENLFRDWRYNSDGQPKKDFVLNNPTYKGKILVAAKNFGCGSSREHAAWAIKPQRFPLLSSLEPLTAPERSAGQRKPLRNRLFFLRLQGAPVFPRMNGPGQRRDIPETL